MTVLPCRRLWSIYGQKYLASSLIETLSTCQNHQIRKMLLIHSTPVCLEIVVRRPSCLILFLSYHDFSQRPSLSPALLLLIIDDVVEALEERMKGNGSKNRKYKNGSKGKLPCNEACLRNQPKEGVLLFPGAVVVSGGTNKPEPQQKLVVHCDECQNEIAGKVFCCKTCFDYDLCEVCYESGATMSHANGKHDFAVEG